MDHGSALTIKLHQRCAPPTLSHGFDGDDFTGVSTARGGDGHHPDAVLTVPTQVGDAVVEHIWGRFKLTAHLDEGRHSGWS